jgi:hypothetical protein
MVAESSNAMKSFHIQKMRFASRVQRLQLITLLVLGGLVIWWMSTFLQHNHTSFVFHHGPLPAATRVCSFWTTHRAYDNLTEDSTTSAHEYHLQLFKHFYILAVGSREEW